MSEAAVPRAVVAGHAGFAAGMVSAVDRIAGRGAVKLPCAMTRMTGMFGCGVARVARPVEPCRRSRNRPDAFTKARMRKSTECTGLRAAITMKAEAIMMAEKR